MKIPRVAASCVFAFIALACLRGQTPSLSLLVSRVQVGADANVMAGFTVGPGGDKTVLIRGIGPALAAFGIEGALADPKLVLYSGSKKINNDNWLAADAATFDAVGAFRLPAGSRDAAIVATLAPGNYTVQLSGVGGATGVALIEIHEVGAGVSRLTHLSTRAWVGAGSDILIPGLTLSSGDGTRRLLIRAAGPAITGAPANVPGALADPTLTVLNSAGAAIATNDNWGTPIGASAASPGALASAATEAGASAFDAGSRDAAVLADLGPGSYTLQISGVGGTSGVALVEVYDLAPSAPPAPTTPSVTLAATKPTADETGATAGEFVFTRTGDASAPLTVNYGVGGNATNGVDYPSLPGTFTIPAGASSAALTLQPLADTLVEAPETVTLTLGAGSGYELGGAISGAVTIADSAGTLYVAVLRPSSAAIGSAASGLATIVLSASGTVATVNVTFSNLSSGQVGAHLFLGNSTDAGDYVLNLPRGQVTGAQWNIRPTGTYTSAQILDALRNGLIYVGLDSAQFPAGELRGAFLSATGSQNFVPPPEPPSDFSLTDITATDAGRLLAKARSARSKTRSKPSPAAT